MDKDNHVLRIVNNEWLQKRRGPSTASFLLYSAKEQGVHCDSALTNHVCQ